MSQSAIARSVAAMVLLIGSPASVAAQQASASPNVERSARGASATVQRPGFQGRSVYIDQIGIANQARVEQASPVARAEVRQDGERNAVELLQRGSAHGFADIRQSGDDNSGRIVQGGVGANTLVVRQQGGGNRLRATQTADAGPENAAALMQAGFDNRMALTQQGADNQAVLVQNGDGNMMTAAQNGDGNRLVWTQTGNGLSDLSIVQSGGQAMQITQSR